MACVPAAGAVLRESGRDYGEFPGPGVRVEDCVAVQGGPWLAPFPSHSPTGRSLRGVQPPWLTWWPLRSVQAGLPVGMHPADSLEEELRRAFVQLHNIVLPVSCWILFILFQRILGISAGRAGWGFPERGEHRSLSGPRQPSHSCLTEKLLDMFLSPSCTLKRTELEIHACISNFNRDEVQESYSFWLLQ